MRLRSAARRRRGAESTKDDFPAKRVCNSTTGTQAWNCHWKGCDTETRMSQSHGSGSIFAYIYIYIGMVWGVNVGIGHIYIYMVYVKALRKGSLDPQPHQVLPNPLALGGLHKRSHWCKRRCQKNTKHTLAITCPQRRWKRRWWQQSMNIRLPAKHLKHPSVEMTSLSPALHSGPRCLFFRSNEKNS